MPAITPLEVTQTIQEQGVPLASTGSQSGPKYLFNLGERLRAHYALTGNSVDLDEAIKALQEAVRLTATGFDHRFKYFTSLANALRDKYIPTGELSNLKSTREIYELVCREGLKRDMETVLVVARIWGDWALERQEWAEAARAYGYALEAIDYLYHAQLLRQDKEAWLHEARGLHPRAAIALARGGDLRGAVVTLERGRAFLLAEAMEYERPDLKRLHAIGYSDLYESYQRVMERLTSLNSEADRQKKKDKFEIEPPVDILEELRRANSELQAIIENMRQIPGYKSFFRDWFRPPTFANIQNILLPIQSTEQAVALVYTAATSVGGVALIVHPSGNISELWMDRLTEKALRELVGGSRDKPTSGSYLSAYKAWRNAPRDKTTREAWFAALDKITRWLWDALMGSLVDVLSSSNIKQAVLIPQGWLGLLPLHAAWKEDAGQPTGRRYALDTICFTYAPNARALSAARVRANIAPDSLFVVDNPDGSLAYAQGEVARARGRFQLQSSGVQRSFQIVDQKTATRKTVQAELPNYSVLHFCTHGRAGWDEPLSGGLLLAKGEQITLRDLLALRLDKARLAILSSCETGIPGTQLPDEVISLPTGLLQAGVGGVVASLWVVDEASTMILMVRFYDLWPNEGLSPAEALRQAQIWWRDTPRKEKRAYFKTLRSRGGDETITARQALEALRDQDHSYAHPYHWAGFSYTGV